jgi:glycosyltransferase involved in cell wall biosynthesis
MSDMHVMHVIDTMHGGGAEISLLEMAPDLIRRGIRMSIVTLLADDGVLEERLGRLGIPRIRLKHRDPLRLVIELRNVIKAGDPDILHTTLMFANMTGRLATCTTHTPVITTLANEDYGPEHRANSRYGAWAVRAIQGADMCTAPLTTRFHAISVDVARVMSRRLRIPRDRIQVIYRGRDPARLGTPSLERRLSTRAALSIDAKTPVVLSVGRLDRQKGIDTTIEAFGRLTKRMPDAILLIAGRPGNSSVEVQAKARGYSAIRLLGHRTDVPDLMCAADVLSFPSRWEGLGGTLVEAMALRLAIVASDISPLVETIGDVGWPLVRPDDGQALTEALASLLRPGTVNDVRKNAGESRFREFFTAEAAADKMARLYRDVLRETRPSQ